MNTGATNIQLVQKLNLPELILYDGTTIWETTQAQADRLMAAFNVPPSKGDIFHLAAQTYSWSDCDPVLLITDSDYGLVFASFADAERIIPILRFDVLIEQKVWFLAVHQKEIPALLAKQGSARRITEMETEPDVEIYELQPPSGYLRLFDGVLGKWFSRLEQIKVYQEWIKESDDQYQMWAGSI